jgi:hypothetical protein
MGKVSEAPASALSKETSCCKGGGVSFGGAISRLCEVRRGRAGVRGVVVVVVRRQGAGTHLCVVVSLGHGECSCGGGGCS